MQVCSIVGCRCQGITAGHQGLKAHEYGFTYYAASYWYRWCEPHTTYVSLVAGKAEEAASRGADYELALSDCHCHKAGCCYCDIVVGGESTYRTRDLFTPAELMEHRRALLAGEVVALYR